MKLSDFSMSTAEKVWRRCSFTGETRTETSTSVFCGYNIFRSVPDLVPICCNVLPRNNLNPECFSFTIKSQILVWSRLSTPPTILRFGISVYYLCNFVISFSVQNVCRNLRSASGGVWLLAVLPFFMKQ